MEKESLTHSLKHQSYQVLKDMTPPLSYSLFDLTGKIFKI